jgi:hypothetical protein
MSSCNCGPSAADSASQVGCGQRVQRIIVNDCVVSETMHVVLTEEQRRNPPSDNLALYNVATWGKKVIRPTTRRPVPVTHTQSR